MASCLRLIANQLDGISLSHLTPYIIYGKIQNERYLPDRIS